MIQEYQKHEYIFKKLKNKNIEKDKYVNHEGNKMIINQYDCTVTEQSWCDSGHVLYVKYKHSLILLHHNPTVLIIRRILILGSSPTPIPNLFVLP